MKLRLIATILFLWAVFGTGAVDALLYWLGGYAATISAVVRDWCDGACWRRPVCIVLWLALGYHLFVQRKSFF